MTTRKVEEKEEKNHTASVFVFITNQNIVQIQKPIQSIKMNWIVIARNCSTQHTAHDLLRCCILLERERTYTHIYIMINWQRNFDSTECVVLCGSCKHHGDKYVAYAAVTATKIALEADQMLENHNQITAKSAHTHTHTQPIRKTSNRITKSYRVWKGRQKGEIEWLKRKSRQ